MRTITQLLGSLLLTALALSVRAGTLDHAPVRVTPPSKDWQLNDSAVETRARGVYIMASLTNLQNGLTARIIKTDFTQSPKEKSLLDVFRNMYAFFAWGAPVVQRVADDSLTFLGYKARRLCWQGASDARQAHLTYVEAVYFQVGQACWSIDCTGERSQTNEVRQFFSAVTRNPPVH